MKNEMKQWVENWQRVGSILEKLESEKLRSPDYGEGLHAFIPTLNWVCEHSIPRQTSGLVEQQRLFAKGRKPKQNK